MADKYGIHFAIAPIADAYLAASPTPANAKVNIFAAPASPNSRIEVISIDVVCSQQLAVDGTNDVLVGTIKLHDASADSDTTLFTGAAAGAGDLLTAVLDLNEAYHLWSGVARLEPGDSIFATLTTTTPDTPGQGYAFIVAYRVKEWNGE